MSGEFDAFVTSTGPELLRLAYLLTGDRHRAEDLVQAALVKAYRRWDTVRHADRPVAFVRTIVLREHLSWWRRPSSRELPTPTVPSTRAHEDPATEVAAQDEVWRMLATLTRMQRAVLVLRYYEDLPDGQIAELLGCRPATVRSHAARGLDKLRRAATPGREVPAHDRPRGAASDDVPPS